MPWRLVTALLLIAPMIGCVGEPPVEPRKFTPPPKPKPRTPLEVKDWSGTIKGKVVYDGDPPSMPFIGRINDSDDREVCLKGGPGESHRQTWVVDKTTRAVANVVLWLEPPQGKYFVLPEKVRERAGELVVIDQPHCAFVPHVVTLFPSYFDGARQVETGQKLQIRNSAPVIHSVQWNPNFDNDAFSRSLAPRGGHVELVLHPQKSCLAIGCSLHNWMHGIVWIFDHPFHTVTKEDGTFEIHHLPVGVEIVFKAWHESNIHPFEQKSMTLTAGDNPPMLLRVKQ